MLRRYSPASKEKRHYEVAIPLNRNYTTGGSSAPQHLCTSVQYIGEEFGPAGEKGWSDAICIVGF